MRRALAVVFALCAAQGVAAQARFVSSYTWQMDDPLFGGISGLDIAPDGEHFTAVGDRGIVLQGRLIRTDGIISGVEAGPIYTLQTPDGEPVENNMSDSEGIAVAPDGTTYISFERVQRVAAYDRIDGPARRILGPRDFRGLQNNAGLEALAIGPNGALYTLPERSGRADRPFPVFRYSGGAWGIPFIIPRRGSFLPVGADIGPDDLFYLLERDYSGLGFRSRVRRFDLNGQNEETLLETSAGSHGNLEGISVWQDSTGAIRLTMVADNNFSFLQSTELAEFTLTTGTAKR